MFIRARYLACICLTLLSLAAAVLWVTSFRHPLIHFLDLVGSIKRENEIQEELRTKGQAQGQMWFGPIGIVEIHDGLLTLRYDGAEFTGSIPPFAVTRRAPRPHTVDWSLAILDFHYVGKSEWNGSSWTCDSSLWFLSAAFGLYPALLFLRFLRQTRRDRSGFCDKCGYNLTGLTEPRCPECGKEFDHAGLAPQPSIANRPLAIGSRQSDTP